MKLNQEPLFTEDEFREGPKNEFKLWTSYEKLFFTTLNVKLLNNSASMDLNQFFGR